MATPSPVISVILPVYNGADYLQQAIESVLQQTFTDFELLVINDGSTDASDNIILSLTDARIRYLVNKENKGLVYTLNRGINEAKGVYIARMDSDDICLPQRFIKQKDWLDKYINTVVVGSLIDFIDENGHASSMSWNADGQTVSADAIRRMMPKENCVAHPSVMMRKEIAKQYLYSENQKNIEDYDLWLRMLSDGLVIEKIPEVLIHYRLHNQSVSKKILQKKNPFYKQFHGKRRFLSAQIKKGKFGLFECRTFVFMMWNLIMGFAKAIKQKIVA